MKHLKSFILLSNIMLLLTRTYVNTQAIFKCKVVNKTYSFNVTVPNKYQSIKNKSLKLFSKSIDEETNWTEFNGCVHIKSWIYCRTKWKKDNIVTFMLQVTTSRLVENITNIKSVVKDENLNQWTPLINGFYCYDKHGIEDYDIYANKKEIIIHWSIFKHDLLFFTYLNITVAIVGDDYYQSLQPNRDNCNKNHCKYTIQGLTPCITYKVCIIVSYCRMNKQICKNDVNTICNKSTVQWEETLIIASCTILTIVLLILSVYWCSRRQSFCRSISNYTNPRPSVEIPILFTHKDPHYAEIRIIQEVAAAGTHWSDSRTRSVDPRSDGHTSPTYNPQHIIIPLDAISFSLLPHSETVPHEPAFNFPITSTTISESSSLELVPSLEDEDM